MYSPIAVGSVSACFARFKKPVGTIFVSSVDSPRAHYRVCSSFDGKLSEKGRANMFLRLIVNSHEPLLVCRQISMFTAKSATDKTDVAG